MLIVYAVIITLVAMFLALCIRVVNQQTILIVEFFGKFSHILTPGIHLILFPVQRIAGSVSLKIESIKTHVEIKTEDNQFVQLPINLMIQVDEHKVKDAFYRLEDPHAQIRDWVLNTVRSTAAAMKLEDLFKDKTTIVESVRITLSVKLNEFGYKIENVLIDQPVVHPDVQASFNRVVSAKRDKEAAEQEGDAVKIRMVKQAEAESEAQQRRAEGLSASRKILAAGLKESIGQFEGVSTTEAINLLVETNRIDAMRDIGKHGNLILMDVNSEANKALLPLLKNIKKPEIAKPD